jgi:hypothetical protein
MIEERKAQGWKFMFLGADIDAYGLASQIGIDADEAVSMDKRFMAKALRLQSSKATAYHDARLKLGAKAAAMRASYTAEEKADLGETNKS